MTEYDSLAGSFLFLRLNLLPKTVFANVEGVQGEFVLADVTVL
jgi:hypothetical protein